MTTKHRDDFITWDECFMRIAKTIAKRSKDPSTQVGSVIANPENVVIGMGYNGFPRGVSNDSFPWEKEGEYQDTKYAYICHSEENAIYNANNDTKNCKIYTSLFPCNECAKTIIQNGIKEVVFESDQYADRAEFIAAKRMFDAAGVAYRQYSSSWEESSSKF